MKYRFILSNLDDKTSVKYRTLKEVADNLKVPYHQARSLYLADKKQFLHPVINKLYTQYRILDNSEN